MKKKFSHQIRFFWRFSIKSIWNRFSIKSIWNRFSIKSIWNRFLINSIMVESIHIPTMTVNGNVTFFKKTCNY